MLKQNLLSEGSIRIYELDPTPTNGRPDYRSCIENRLKVMYFRGRKTGLNYDSISRKLIDEGVGLVRFLAHCNGLFCICIAGDILLWNPYTEQTRKLPPPNIDDPRECDRATFVFGLGYDSSTDDYKLVRICVFEGLCLETEVKVYSRNTGIWQRIQDFPYAFPLLRPGVYAKGCLYWRIWPCEVEGYVGSRDIIVALDLANNSYSTLPIPMTFFPWGNLEIGSLGDKLVAFFGCCTAIWVLKEHGWWSSTDIEGNYNRNGWLRTQIILDCGVRSLKFYEAMCLMKPGLALVRVEGDKVTVFDIEMKEPCKDTEEYYKIPVDNEKGINFRYPVDKDEADFTMVGFVDSLASPYAQEEEEEEEEEEESSVIHGNALSKIRTTTVQAEEDCVEEVIQYPEEECLVLLSWTYKDAAGFALTLIFFMWILAY